MREVESSMLPASSVSGLYFALPESRYFGVGRIERDQVLDYSRRKGITYAAWREAGIDPAVLRRAGIRRAGGA